MSAWFLDSELSTCFLNKKAFESRWSLKPVTVARASATGIIKRKHITIIDIPGFLDPSSLSKEDEFIGLAKAILDMPKGVNTVGLLINIKIVLPPQMLNYLKCF